MKKYDRISTVFWFIVGGYCLSQGQGLHLGTLKEPGSGFLVFWAGAVLCLLAAMTFIGTFRRKEEGSESPWEGAQWQKPLLVLMVGVVYVLCFPWLGFLLSTFLLMLFLFKYAGVRRWTHVLFASLLSVSCSWFLFYVGLQVQFPQGFLEGIVIRLLGLSV